MVIDAQKIQFFGLITIHYYALILMTGMLVASWLTARRGKHYGLDPNYVWDGLMWAIIPGLLGARLYHVFTPSPASGLSLQYYLQNPLQIFAIWNGGLGIYGGIVGGILGVWYYTRRHKQPLLKWLDIIAPAMAIAQAIGRWGNFVNQELYGAPTDLPWAVYIEPKYRLPGYGEFATFHPLFLYESLWNFSAALLLIFIHHRFKDRLRDGDILMLYLMQYTLIRFILDFVRLDSNGFGAITTAQIISVAVFVIAGVILIARRRFPRTVAGESPRINSENNAESSV